MSDQIFRIFPVNRLRKYHHQELAHAILAAVVDARLAATETGPDRNLAAGTLAAYLTELFTLHQFKKVEYAADLLRPFDFVPAVDQLLYAPLLASSSSYFGDVQDEDRVRDDVRLFADPAAPSPRLVYNKLLDLLGGAAFPALARKTLNEGVPFRRAAAETFGADLDWFWRQWLGPLPRVNYRLESVRVTPAAGGGSHVEIDVRREGDADSRAGRGRGGRPRGRHAGPALGRRDQRRISSPSSCRPASSRWRSIRARAWSRPRSARCGGRTIRATTTAIRSAGVCSTRGSARCSTSRR